MLCDVEVEGLDGHRHRVSVEASTLNEAAARGVALLKTAAFKVDLYNTMNIMVTVHPPSTLHVVQYAKLLNWLNSSSSPKDLVAKEKLKKILEGIQDA